MKKELVIHLGSFVIFFLIITLIHRWFNFSVAMFWLGGLIGTLLPNIDHLIYSYFLRPHELTSQRVKYLMQKGEVVKTGSLLASTQAERQNLIFHTAWFQFLFILVAFFVISSSSNLLGRGLVLAFLLHLFMDQLVELVRTQTLVNWFRQINFNWQKEQYTLYVLVMFLVILTLGVLL